jgi:ribosome-associated protein
MDIRKLQRAIVDGLEDVKGQNIAVFNTEHLSPLFERVIIASGTSNRQTKALAASVRDAVKARGFAVLRTEGEDNGEWIIVDCGAAVVHVMQPNIRDYYHLEEIWGGKPVKMKVDTAPKRLVRAEADDGDADEAPARAPRKAPAARKTARAPADEAPAAKPARKAAPRKTPADKGAPAPVKAAGAPAPARKAAAKRPGAAPRAAAAPAPRRAGAAPATGARKAGGASAGRTAGSAGARPGVTRTVGVKGRAPAKAAKKAGSGA